MGIRSPAIVRIRRRDRTQDLSLPKNAPHRVLPTLLLSNILGDPEYC